MARKTTTPTELEGVGVHYYNIYNRDNKNNIKNIDNDFSNQALISASDEALDPPGQEREAQPQDIVALQAPTPALPLDQDQVRSCVVQLFDNGESSSQRYKVKVRLNLTDGTNPEFIGSVTKDFRNFKKYIPQPYTEEIIDFARQYRQRVKQQYGVLAYLGKLHFNTHRSSHRQAIQIEPNTVVAVYWDKEEMGWSGMLQIQNFCIQFDMFSDTLTELQRRSGIKAQEIWRNPTIKTVTRPQTWAERRNQTKG